MIAAISARKSAERGAWPPSSRHEPPVVRRCRPRPVSNFLSVFFVRGMVGPPGFEPGTVPAHGAGWL